MEQPTEAQLLHVKKIHAMSGAMAAYAYLSAHFGWGVSDCGRLFQRWRTERTVILTEEVARKIWDAGFAKGELNHGSYEEFEKLPDFDTFYQQLIVGK